MQVVRYICSRPDRFTGKLSPCYPSCYRPPTKLREGNVFSRVSVIPFTEREGGDLCTGPQP